MICWTPLSTLVVAGAALLGADCALLGVLWTLGAADWTLGAPATLGADGVDGAAVTWLEAWPPESDDWLRYLVSFWTMPGKARDEAVVPLH
jgi:hypothetical protein